MNKQVKKKKGVVVSRGIEWTDATWNPIAGCLHACQWVMPSGEVANCYAEDTAESAQAAPFYPAGFEHHYWYPGRLDEPLRVKTPMRIFVGSMADVFGHWVPVDQIGKVMQTAIEAHWHTFQFLTKNPVRIIHDNLPLPKNAWIGASTPPDFMWNKPLKRNQQEAMLRRTLEILSVIAEKPRTTWISAEPLSWDIVPVLRDYPDAIKWIVIGAASNGRRYYPPEEAHVRDLIGWCDDHGVSVFMKGNLRSLPYAAANWREEYPS